MKRDQRIAEQDALIKERSAQLEEKSAQLEEQSAQLEEQSAQLEEQRVALLVSAKAMKTAGIPDEQIAAITKITIEEIKQL